MRIDPTLSCCARPASEHAGAVCPDGLIMCCLCFVRFPMTPTTTEDVCPPCLKALWVVADEDTSTWGWPNSE